MGDDVLLAFDGYCLDVAQGVSATDKAESGSSAPRASTCCTTSFGTPAGSSAERVDGRRLAWRFRLRRQPHPMRSRDPTCAKRRMGTACCGPCPSGAISSLPSCSGVSARDFFASAPPELRRDPANDATTSVGGKSSFKIFENVPPQLPSFVGREAALSDLHRLLTTGEQRAATAQVAIHGLGGRDGEDLPGRPVRPSVCQRIRRRVVGKGQRTEPCSWAALPV